MRSLSIRSGRAAPVAALLLGALAMGISPIFVRLAEVGPFTSAFWRIGLAMPLLWTWMTLSERNRPVGAPKPVSFPRATVLAGVIFGADLFFWHLSIAHTTIANATFFATAAPVWVVVFGWLLFRQRVTSSVMMGLGLCLVGGAALVIQSMQVDLSRLPGDAYGVITGVLFGLYFLAVGAARRTSSAARVTFELSLIAVAILFVAALVLDHDFLPKHASGWAALLAIAWISHAGGQGLLSIALGQLPPVFSSLVIFLEAIVAALFAWAVLGEAVTSVQAIGGAFIVLGIWIARPRTPAATETSGGSSLRHVVDQDRVFKDAEIK
ncbi:DMT family transporter [Lichenihabitans psoromatis]|uniref:DMT family transporter n=1 Tax=Lichenihabitans psoromatis TaxID=2528642 RepID=UPI00103852E8|nr:DMT family transporter [Lichenihabitans psoromatis]